MPIAQPAKKTGAGKQLSRLPAGATTTQRVLVALLGLAILVAFHRVLTCSFVNWDDDVYVYANPHLSAGLSGQGIGWALTSTHAGFWLPVTWLSLLLDYQLFGLQAWGYHFTNLLLHVANVYLAYRLFWCYTGRFYRSLVAAGLFGLHPLRVESVAWVTERKDVLSSCLGLLALLSYAYYVGRPTLWRYVLLWTSFMLSVMAKPMLVTLPCLLLLLDYWPLRRWQPFGRPTDDLAPAPSPRPLGWLIGEKIPLFLLAVAASAIAWHTQTQVDAVKSLQDFPLTTRMANALVAYARYVKMTLAPFGLAPLYPYAADELTVWKVAGATLAWCAAFGLGAWQIRRQPALFIGLCWFTGTLIPVSGLFQSGGQALADRFTYFPSLGLFMALTWGIADGLAAMRWPAPCRAGLAVIVLLLSAGFSAAQVAHWHDSLTLWKYTLKVTARNGMAHHNLGEALEKRQQWQAALEQFDKSLLIDPSYPRTHYNRGVALEQLNRLEEARASLQRACQLNPTFVAAYSNQGSVLAKLNRPEEALASLKRACDLDPEYVPAFYNQGVVLEHCNRLEEAASALRRVCELDAAHVSARYNLGVVLYRLSRFQEAKEQFRSVLQMQPDHTRAAMNLELAGRALAESPRAR